MDSLQLVENDPLAMAIEDEGYGTVPPDPDRKPTHQEGRNLFFTDGVSRIDYVLAWEAPKEDDEDSQNARKARELFERNLMDEGLKLEYDTSDESVHFVKVHAPWEVLTRYAEILKMKMKMKKSLMTENIEEKFAKLENPVKAVTTSVWNSILKGKDILATPFQVNSKIFPKIRKEATLTFTREREYLFDIPENNKELFFNNMQRSRIVDFILRRTPFGEDKQEAYTFGIKKMIADDFYSAAFPLHEGHWKAGSQTNIRKTLYENWANWRNAFKFQPLEYIRNYFGSQIGLYFAWLGFYTQWLVVPSLVGLTVFFLGFANMGDNYPSKEVCDGSLNITMCPMCDYQCPYWRLNTSCAGSEYSHLFDNSFTVFFAIFMSLWGTLFLEFWKRKQSLIQYNWDLVDFIKEEEPPRPEYLAKLAKHPHMKVNPITGMKEPHLPFWRRRFPIYVLSYGFTLFTMCIAVAGVIGVIVYRISVLASLQLLEKNSTPDNSTLDETKHVITVNASIITSMTAACINLALILVLNFVYSKLAVLLTDFECLRTQGEYDDSINIKLFALQFVNYYSSIFYIAFFKGRLVGRPGAYNEVFGGRQEECGPAGCLIDLCIQLAIIMAGKQIIQNTLMEIFLPKAIKFMKRCYRKRILKETAEQKAEISPWMKDYELTELSSLYHEYLEMVLQFGFLSIFVAAFPLGPLCCLLNNMIEIRSDALKFTTDLRKPSSERAADIGIWYDILYAISRLAIVSNAFIIALTSDFIPRLVYVYYYSQDQTLKGYTQWTLSAFNTSDFEPDKRYIDTSVEICWYRDFRNPPGPDEYEFSASHWHVLAARFAFVVVFENFVVVITSFIAYLIPDIPDKVKKQIRRAAYISNEIVIKAELDKARQSRSGRDVLSSLSAKEKEEEDTSRDDGGLRKRSSEDRPVTDFTADGV